MLATPCSCSFFFFCSTKCSSLHFTPFFFFNDPAPTEIYPLSLPDALPICLELVYSTRGRGPDTWLPPSANVPENDPGSAAFRRDLPRGIAQVSHDQEHPYGSSNEHLVEGRSEEHTSAPVTATSRMPSSAWK